MSGQKIPIAMIFTALVAGILVATLLAITYALSGEEPVVVEQPYVVSHFTETSGLYIVNKTIITYDDLGYNGHMICVDNKPVQTFQTPEEARQLMEELLNYYSREELR